MQTIPAYCLNWCFFLDVDGTLVGISEHPDLVHVDAALQMILRRLVETTGGAVALISGRAITDIDRLFAPLGLPVAGQHGLERRDGVGNVHVHTFSIEHLKDAAKKLEDLVAQYPDLVFENKGMSLALHYRRAPALMPTVNSVMRQLLAELGNGFELLQGKMLLELKPQGKDKGTAIAEFMKEPPFQGRIPIFIGDDLTDESGFIVVSSLRGHAVKVGTGTTSARWSLPNAAAVRTWLTAFAARYSPVSIPRSM